MHPGEPFGSDFRTEDSQITIGRGAGTDIRLQSNSLSRVQCRLVYMDGTWYACDGDGKRPSTNGTWVYAEEPIRLADGSVFKAGKLIFSVRLLVKRIA